VTDIQKLAVQCFVHKDEVVVVFGQPLSQWFLPPEAALEFAKVFTDLARQAGAQTGEGMTKQ
jgi:hypothetical protein